MSRLSDDPLRKLSTPISHLSIQDENIEDDEMATFALDRVPCSNVGADDSRGCPKAGTMVCSACKLILYCSPECQKQHWSSHKTNCKDRHKNVAWRPRWVQEGREPSFIDGNERDSDTDWREEVHPLGRGMSLWGNMPATDILNLPRNEGLSPGNLAIAFAASGDLRNVIRTVNVLPDDYTGQMTVVLNDRNPFVSIRNVLILSILGSMRDKRIAADIALHMWYSSFVPENYHTAIALCAADVAKSHSNGRFLFTFPGGGGTTFSGALSASDQRLLASLVSSSTHYGAEDAKTELHRVRFSPSRVDQLDRYLFGLEPAHRLSFLESRRSGLVLPFGAPKAHFNVPNRLLFSPEGRWLQSDGANPLESWFLPDVIRSGNAHGARAEDLYGCLYFHVSDELREFGARLARFRLAFTLFSMDALALPPLLRSSPGGTVGGATPLARPSDLRFDRVDVSNILDVEYAGIGGVLEAWAPMLKPTPRATLLGYFMNWPAREKDAMPSSQTVVRRLFARLKREGKLVTAQGALAAVLDNSQAFKRYLNAHGLDAALTKTAMKLKTKNTILPHRLSISLDAAPNTLPVFSDDESWYFQVRVGICACTPNADRPADQAYVTGLLWTERFVEFTSAR
ncbi:hypothetical protein OF83DRAFT_1245784 [Amylostereum chailletii]|nr:hypothetical protein OF83DRAFT_1245784 [Amylostereum chailletii]